MYLERYGSGITVTNASWCKSLGWASSLPGGSDIISWLVSGQLRFLRFSVGVLVTRFHHQYTSGP